MSFKPVNVFPRFYKKAERLRAFFDERFSSERSEVNTPFVWDYWHVPKQYTLLRTPAYLFFPKKIYEDFHTKLVLWGRDNLGCHDVSPTWLSCYVEGCEQRKHVDLPHGPWAFVYSLTNWSSRSFFGGETFLKEEKGARLVAPKFNQLLVFDPSLEHGVRRVRGVHDVTKSRLVIHGWFVNPRPFISGPINPEKVSEKLYDLDDLLSQDEDVHKGIDGVISYKIFVSPTGKVKNVKTLADTLKCENKKLFSRKIQKFLSEKWDFPKYKSGSEITLPLSFSTVSE